MTVTVIKGSQSAKRLQCRTWMCASFALCVVIYPFIAKYFLFYVLSVTSMKDEDKRIGLYQRFYQLFHGDGAKQPADCVVLSLNNQKL